MADNITEITKNLFLIDLKVVKVITGRGLSYIAALEPIEGLNFLIDGFNLDDFALWLKPLSVRQVADALGISVGTAHKLKQAVKAMTDGQ